ncbi:MAG TPA: HAD family hydrolase [Gemmatimonadales bacterium]
MTIAVFLDRDGTLVEDPGFLRDPADVRLFSGSAEAVRRLNASRRRVVVVTNQSGLARGLIRPEEYEAVARRVDSLLGESGAGLDATYLCPHYPPLSGPCQCRKPGTLHFRTAAERFGLDLSACVWIGDRLTDLLPAHAFGGRGILVRTGQGERAAEQARAEGFAVVQDLFAAVEQILLGNRRLTIDG